MDTTAHRIIKRARDGLVDGLGLGLHYWPERNLTKDQADALDRIAEELWVLLTNDPAPPECQNCATALVQAPTGRPRRYCSDACRQRDARALSAPARPAAVPPHPQLS
jgi:hypothetical protein